MAAITFVPARSRRIDPVVGAVPGRNARLLSLPYHYVAVAHGEKPKSWLWSVDLTRPMTRASYKRAFDTARTNPKVTYRFYDAGHTFVTRLA